MILKIKKKHVSAAIEARKTGADISRSCIIFQALKDVDPDIDQVGLAAVHSNGVTKYRLSKEAEEITSLSYTEWKDVKPCEVVLEKL